MGNWSVRMSAEKWNMSCPKNMKIASDSKFQLLGTTTESVMLISKTGTLFFLSQDHRRSSAPATGVPNISCAPVSGAAIHGHTTAIEGTIICQHQPKQTLEAFSTNGNHMKSSPNIPNPSKNWMFLQK